MSTFGAVVCACALLSLGAHAQSMPTVVPNATVDFPLPESVKKLLCDVATSGEIEEEATNK
eukprot:CAMPEP_0198549004 /NCGR_PEP_ID=MMETSP1462-20131121/71600_1 /TAXON_ID=1333877 /ORGANISM="Brandtodinium nutriculum, Strain RCC3387" /LENGTH=60 /DNA_ID=CAMNT_0044279563 /DNA_START=9 /DNA_END=188 /DNA_ORIENTATION=+